MLCETPERTGEVERANVPVPACGEEYKWQQRSTASAQDSAAPTGRREDSRHGVRQAAEPYAVSRTCRVTREKVEMAGVKTARHTRRWQQPNWWSEQVATASACFQCNIEFWQ